MSPTVKRSLRVGQLLGLLAFSLAGYAAFDADQSFLGSITIVGLILLMVSVVILS